MSWNWIKWIRETCPLTLPSFDPTDPPNCRLCNQAIEHYDCLYKHYGFCDRCAAFIGAAYIYARSGEVDDRLDPEGADRQDTQRPASAKRSRPAIDPAVRWEVFRRDKYACRACGSQGSKATPLHIDHIDPLCKGGAHSIENFQTLCQTCNLSKGGR